MDQFHFKKGQLMKKETYINIDNYMIPKSRVDEYVKVREDVAKKVVEVFASMNFKCGREFKGSEDGEAVVAYDENMDIAMLVYLDPDNIIELCKAIKENKLKEYILNNN